MLLNLTPEFARICADITGDGHLQLKDWRGLTSFYSKNIKEIQIINKRFQKNFGIRGRIYVDNSYNRRRYKIFFISKEVAEFLASIGVPVGNKTNQPFFVPAWIFDGNEDIQKAYLRGIFTTEGSIFNTRQKNGKKRWQIGIEFYKWTHYKKEGGEYVNQLKQMLEKLGIRCSPVRFGRRNLRKDGTNSVAIKLDIESKHFRNFYKQIGFDNKEKANKLRYKLRSARRDLAACGGILKELQGQAAKAVDFIRKAF